MLDQDRNEVFSAKVSDHMNTVTKDYVVYQPSGSNEYLLYTYVEGKEITRRASPILRLFPSPTTVRPGWMFTLKTPFLPRSRRSNAALA